MGNVSAWLHELRGFAKKGVMDYGGRWRGAPTISNQPFT